MNLNITLQRTLGLVGAGCLAVVFAAQTPPRAEPPGHENAGEPGASPIGRGPVQAIHAHECGFHFYNGDMKRALRVDHYCSHLKDGVFQCVIYDSNKSDARLIGVEYIIAEKLFNQLPAEEKKLWHSHRYEVSSGQLSAPDLAAGAEKELMQELVNTYGKTWHLWQVDRGDELPLGLPQLMMGFTADNQADPAMVSRRDRDLNINTSEAKAARIDLITHPIAPGADAWQQGDVFQINLDATK